MGQLFGAVQLQIQRTRVPCCAAEQTWATWKGRRMLGVILCVGTVGRAPRQAWSSEEAHR